MDLVNISHMETLPTELILNIFSYLPPKSLIKCRQVCSRWKMIVDRLSNSHALWEKFCKNDFPTIERAARSKAKQGLPWFNLYKSLSLWAKLSEAREDRDEFASASGIMSEICNFQLLDDGVIGVHTKSSITYYDMDTLKESKRGAISGPYSKYAENDSVIVIMSFQLHLYVIRKSLYYHCTELEKTFYNVKMFTLTETTVYFVTMNDEIYMCNLYDDEGSLTATFMKRSDEGVMALGVSDKQLNIVTFIKNIYTVIDNNLVFRCTLGPDSNLLQQFRKYNLLKQMDWRIYMQWMYVFNHTVPEGPFRDLLIIRHYGDVYFVGTSWGVLRIYHQSNSDEEFDLFNWEPVKQYNFMERQDCPVLSMSPIIEVDVSEHEDGHMVFVAMPKKIAVLTFTHNFKRSVSLSMIPYSEVQKVKQLKIDTSS